MIPNQRNVKYSDLTLGKSGVSFNRNACTTCAVYEGWRKITGKSMPMKEFIKYIDYTDKARFPKNDAGLMIWRQKEERYNHGSKWRELGLKTPERVLFSPDKKIASEYANSKDKFMILELDYGAHWVLLENWSLIWFALVQDSWRNNPNTENGLFRAYNKKRITGYAVFEKA